MGKSSLRWFLAVIAVGVAGTFVYLWSHGPRSKPLGAGTQPPSSHQQESDSLSNLVSSEIAVTTNTRGSRVVAATQRDVEVAARNDWVRNLQAAITTIAAKLPELKEGHLAIALRTLPARLKFKFETDTAGKISAYEALQARPTSQGGMAFLEDQATDGFAAIDQILVDGVLEPWLTSSPDRVAAELLKATQAPEDFLGSTEDARKVLTALRWRAAIALRGLPLTGNLRQTLEGVAVQHPDSILRGALAASVVAFQATDPFVESWLERESDVAALEAFLMELTRSDMRLEVSQRGRIDVSFDPNNGLMAGVTFQDRDPLFTYRATSGYRMFEDIAKLLRTTLRAHDCERCAGLSIVVDKPGKHTVTKVTDPKLLAIEALELRLEEGAIPYVLSLIEEEPSARARARMLEMLAKVKSPSAEHWLSSYALDSRKPLEERRSSIRALSSLETNGSRVVVRQLLVDDSPEIRGTAAISYFQSTKDNSIIEQMAITDPDPALRDALKQFLSRVRMEAGTGR